MTNADRDITCTYCEDDGSECQECHGKTDVEIRTGLPSYTPNLTETALAKARGE